ncbi:PAS domain-containing protein [Phaeovulum veldkampii]|uniref:PAS domain-containing protein n=2 Tax=Phaeovulum veldkampii TaxID=33049 RepID=A0A2T4JJP7_9RHOB|nr:PAS domain-containing protein [Phaeovulum veldkampii]PTE18083.1 PAS domain-containing protein [Phaeovulum veldkampii DSM 11550]TDQ57112.1 PAS domain-containing protein [Phaeovulum veldkampii DSM 11550]
MDLNDHTDGKIIALGTAPRSPADRALADLRSYWEALRQGRPVPARAEVDPRGIERALDYTFLLERIAPGMGRFRLAGMHLNDLMGMEVRGMPLSTFFAPLSRKPAAELLEAVFANPAVAEASLHAETGIGQPALAARLLLLPLTSDLGDVNRVLGCLVAEGSIGRSPRRFDLASAAIAPALAGLPVDMSLPVTWPLAPHGLAEPPARPGASTPETRRAALRLVKSDR